MDKLIIEYRDNPSPDIMGKSMEVINWKRSAMDWTVEDMMSMNKLFGYEKYKVRKVSV